MNGSLSHSLYLGHRTCPYTLDYSRKNVMNELMNGSLCHSPYLGHRTCADNSESSVKIRTIGVARWMNIQKVSIVCDSSVQSKVFKAGSDESPLLCRTRY